MGIERVETIDRLDLSITTLFPHLLDNQQVLCVGVPFPIL